MVFFWTESPATQNGVLALMEVDCHIGAPRIWNPRPVGDELALCQRYYEKSYNIDVKPGTAQNRSGALGSLSHGDGWWLENFMAYFAVSKRSQAIAITTYSPYTGAAGYAGEYNTTQAFIADRKIQLIEVSAKSYAIAGDGGTFNANNVEWHHFTAETEL
jgi:hypothetical protein